MDIAKAVSLTHDQLDLFIGRFYPRVTHAESYGVQYVVLMPFNLFIQFLEGRNSAMTGPPKPAFQFSLSLCSIFVFEEQTQVFLQTVSSIKPFIVLCYHGEFQFLIYWKAVSESIGGKTAQEPSSHAPEQPKLPYLYRG